MDSDSTTPNKKITKGRIVTKGGTPPFSDVHPREGRSKKFRSGGDLPPYGGSDGLESKYKRCKQCGFVLNTFVNQRGSGWGNEIATELVGTRYTDVDSGAGCPLCSSSEY